jgi:hypothetical protein
LLTAERRIAGSRLWSFANSGGRVMRDLGAPVAATRAHGPHMWIPLVPHQRMQINFTVDDAKEPRTKTVLTVSDFRWDLPLDPTLFDATVPAGYRETSSVRESLK